MFEFPIARLPYASIRRFPLPDIQFQSVITGKIRFLESLPKSGSFGENYSIWSCNMWTNKSSGYPAVEKQLGLAGALRPKKRCHGGVAISGSRNAAAEWDCKRVCLFTKSIPTVASLRLGVRCGTLTN